MSALWYCYPQTVLLWCNLCCSHCLISLSYLTKYLKISSSITKLLESKITSDEKLGARRTNILLVTFLNAIFLMIFLPYFSTKYGIMTELEEKLICAKEVLAIPLLILCTQFVTKVTRAKLAAAATTTIIIYFGSLSSFLEFTPLSTSLPVLLYP